MSSTSSSTSSGISFAGLLAVLFIGLKLTGYINWSWVWVVSPLWIPLAIVTAVALTLCLMYLGALVAARFW